MNEEELKKRREYLRESETDRDFLNWCDKVDLYEKGFQKGKLQAQKEEEGFLISIDNYYGFEDCMIELHEKLQKRIKQLQKEIGGWNENNW